MTTDLGAEHDRLTDESLRLMKSNGTYTLERARRQAAQDEDIEASPLARYWFITDGVSLPDLARQLRPAAKAQAAADPDCVWQLPLGVAADVERSR